MFVYGLKDAEITGPASENSSGFNRLMVNQFMAEPDCVLIFNICNKNLCKAFSARITGSKRSCLRFCNERVMTFSI